MRTRLIRSFALTACIAGTVAACSPRVVSADGSGDGAPGTDVSRADQTVAPDGIANDVVLSELAFPDMPPEPDSGSVDVGLPETADDVQPEPDVAPPEDIQLVDATDVVVPPPDVVVTVDVPIATDGGACPIVRALSLPMDSAMAMVTGASRNATTSCASSGGPENLYSLHVAARTGVQLATTANYDTVLAIRRVCDSATGEIACNDDIPGSNNSRLRTILDPGDYFVLVDQFGGGPGGGGTYTLNLTSYTPATNGTCATGAALTPGTSVIGDVRGGGASSNACATASDGPQLFYTLSIPPGQRAVVTATPTGTPGWSAVVRALNDCASTFCVANGTSSAAGMPAVENIDNRTGATLNVVVSVSSTSVMNGGTFNLDAMLVPVPASPANATCSMARAVTDGAMVTGENASLASMPLAAACLATARGNVLYYRISVPARNTLAITATPSSNWDPVIRLLGACGATSCLASSDAAASNTPERLNYLNAGTTTQDILIAVGSDDPATTGLFDLRVALLPPPANNTCAAATAVMNGTALTVQNSAAGTENATAACAPTLTGAVLYYRATIAPGSTLAVRAAPVGTMDPAIRILSACGATSCLASSNAAGAGMVETANYTNAGAADQNVIIAIGGATNASNGVFDVSFGIGRVYVETTITGSCDDMTGGTPVPGVGGDDTVSTIIDLPFAFRFFGEVENEFSVSSNGLVQLWPTLAGAPSNSFGNAAIPSTGGPDRFIAPLWDDLIPNAMSTTLTRTTGTAPNRRFTVQWANTSFFNDNTARLTFQAKLFETTDVIEFHYCMLTPGMTAAFATGSSASIGIENANGMLGRQHSFNTPMSISTANGIRYTP